LAIMQPPSMNGLRAALRFGSAASDGMRELDLTPARGAGEGGASMSIALARGVRGIGGLVAGGAVARRGAARGRSLVAAGGSAAVGALLRVCGAAR
jgi:hypothetical protein